MSKNVSLEELQGLYDIAYASSPPVENFYEAGFGSAQIEGEKLSGVDALGVIWSAEFTILNDGTISYNAILDPKDTPLTVGLMNKSGVMTREPQNYNGIMKVTKSSAHLILRTEVQQGPITINVQFRKKP